jgi:hypothetical protein
MSLNIELLRKVQQHILAHPEQVDMRTYGDCGTVGCIAFHACKIADGVAPHAEEVGDRAGQLLEISWLTMDELFIPDDLCSYRYPGTPEHAQRVSDHIDRFIAKYEAAQ